MIKRYCNFDFFVFRKLSLKYFNKKKSYQKLHQNFTEHRKTTTKLNLIDYKITSLNKLLVNSKNMRDGNSFNNSQDKNKQRKSFKNMNNQNELNANIDFN